MARLILVITFLIVAGGVFLFTQSEYPAAAESVGDPVRGAEIFQSGINGAPPCGACHAVESGSAGRAMYGVGGPNLGGLSLRAGDRVEGLSAEEYVHNSIIDPAAYVVEGFGNNMYKGFADQLTEQDIADLVAYALSL